MSHPYLVGLIGAGVGPSLTPPMHMAEGAHHGLTYLYRPIDIAALGLEPERVGDVIEWGRRLGYDAFNVTHPCKQLVLSHLDRVDERAAALGAVNTVVFEDGEAVGYNTDVTGFAKAFSANLPDADLEHVVLLGAGGAGSAVADALLGLGARHLSVIDVDKARVSALVNDLARRYPASTVDAGRPDDLVSLTRVAGGIVHATPTGMADHPGTPVDPALLHPDMWVADIVYRPLDTELLQAARHAGCATLHGGHMAVYQAVDAFRLITGIDPDAARMLEHFHTLVA